MVENLKINYPHKNRNRYKRIYKIFFKGKLILIISQTPFRYSFVGGGTDLKKFYIKEPGQVLSTSIDKYLYVIVRRQVGDN